MNSINDYNRVQYVNGDYNFSSNTYTLVDKNNYQLLNSNNLNPVPIDYYDLYLDENNNIFFCYTIHWLYTHSNVTYSFTLQYLGNNYIINNQDYKNIYDIIDKQLDILDGGFTFNDSTPVNSKGRCDAAGYGPMTFLRPEDPDNNSDSKSPVLESSSMLKRFTPFLSVDRIGHINYLEVEDLSLAHVDTNENTMPKSTYTISELLKLMLEWAELVNPPWNSLEPISVKSDLFFRNLNIPSEVKDDLINNQTDMQVARYLMGNTNARERPPMEEISEISPILKRWILSKFFFSSIDELKANLMV
jgi:hypothetical protein